MKKSWLRKLKLFLMIFPPVAGLMQLLPFWESKQNLHMHGS